MSLHIALYDNNEDDGDDAVIEMNWVRNPFGLCRWAEDNAHHRWGGPPETDLYQVVNKWSYDDAINVDRALFKVVVDKYASELQELRVSFFFFKLPQYRQFVELNIRQLPGQMDSVMGIYLIDGSFYDDSGRIAIPVDHFNQPVFNYLGNPTTQYYQRWFDKLQQFAELLQDENLSFYCSN